jgi:neutral ceramidase
MAGAEDGRTEMEREGIAINSDFDKAMLDAARGILVGVLGALMPAIAPVLGPLAPAVGVGGGTATGVAAGMMAASSDQCQYPKPIILPTGYMHWSPEILPFQVFRIGSVAIVGIPGEMTMQAGRRLEAAVRAVLLPLGVQRVLLTGLANEYSGYITTPEEYPSQQYEGASTLFGRLTFDAYREAFQDLGVAMASGKTVRSGPPAGDLSVGQIEWKPEVDHDELPIGETFGQILLQPKQTVARGTVARMIYRAGNPRNDLRRNDSYIRIERDSGGGVALAAWDGIPETRLYWSRSYAPILTEGGPIGQACPGTPCFWSTMDVRWSVPPDAVPGTYHIRAFGSWKNGVTGAITPYETTSAPFRVQ